MNKNHEIFDKEAAKEKWQYILGGLFVFLIVTLLLSFTVPISSKQTQGTMIGLTARQTDVGSKQRAQIKLQSGATILAVLPKHMNYKEQGKVELLQEQTLVGRPRYRVISYVQ